MDPVEIFLLCVVAFSVAVVLIIGYLEPEAAEEEEYDDDSVSTMSSCEKSGFGRAISDINGNKEEETIDDDWIWEGIERTELEKIFGEAVVYVSCNNGDDGIHEDVKLELYGLLKIALEGPCCGSRPMALKVSARSKWKAWHKLGNMSREMAMENYIDILSKVIPHWKNYQ
ncbi:hypothetical protein OROMI_000658 [Orobanche minor]